LTVPVPAYPAPLGLLKGKTIVVTAAAGTGIGYAVAKRAAEEGARVLISDFHERRLGEAADRIAAEVGCARPATFVCDVTSEDAVQALRDAALAIHAAHGFGAFSRSQTRRANSGIGTRRPSR